MDVHGHPSKLTLPNALSLARLLVAVPCAFAIVAGQWQWAALAFAFAVVSDMADGRLARSRGQVTALGGVLDHGSDALFVVACLSALVLLEIVPVLLPPLVAAAFVQYLLDSKALAGFPLRTSVLGRANGVAYFVLVAVPVVQHALRVDWIGSVWVAGFGWLLVVTTLASMLDRFVAVLRLRRGQSPVRE